jgi:DNA-binding CsgD family transcriptional regulator
MTSFTERELDSVLQVTASTTLTGQPLLDTVAAALLGASRSDAVTVFDLVPSESVMVHVAGAGEEDEDPPEAVEAFWETFWTSDCSWAEPGTPYYGRIPRYAVWAPETAYPTWGAYTRSPFYRGYARMVGLGHYALVPLHSAAGTTRRILLNRPESDEPFSSGELTMLRLLQPHLDAAVARALTGRTAAELLSARELEVLAYVRAGHPTSTIASLLWVQPSTVRKHLENAFAKLGVHTRAAAVARVFTDVPA